MAESNVLTWFAVGTGAVQININPTAGVPGPVAFSINVTGNVITTTLAQGAGLGIVTTTFAQYIAAMLADPAVAALIANITYAGGGGGNINNPMQNTLPSVGAGVTVNLSGVSGTGPLDFQNPEFAIVLYDNAWRQRMNLPVNCNRFVHYPLQFGNPMNFYPAPGIMYPVNSVIRFDAHSLIPPGGGLPQINLLFVGSRRIKCQ